MIKVLFVLLAYLLGSIPFSYLLGEAFRGQDIRRYGSGNIGTTNAYRVFGKIIGTAVLLLDTLKSGLIVFLMVHTNLFAGLDLFPALIYGFASVLGHVFPVWFKFKGGKGVATSFGLLLAYNPWIAAVMLPVFLLTELFTRYVSVASTVTAVTTFVLVVILYFAYRPDLWLVLITFLSTALILWRHRSNYQRLKNGTENKVKWLDKLEAKFKRK